MWQTLNDLPERVRADAIALLNQQLADALDLHLQAKQAHWNVKGPNFIALHELFDEVEEELEEHADDIAALSAALAAFGNSTRAAIDAAAALGDADTADLFTGVSRGVDKLLWKVEAHNQ